MNPAPDRRALVVCVGNQLVADDGIGCAVYDRLVATGLPDGVRAEMVGLGGLALLDWIDGEETLVVVDAVQTGGAAGVVHVWDWDHVPAAQGPAVSAHGIGVREAIAVGRALNPAAMPRTIRVIGVEGACFDRLGEGLTPAVAAAVGEAAAAVEACIREAQDGVPARG